MEGVVNLISLYFFTALSAGIPLLEPYLNSDALFSHGRGVNFAVAGSTALPVEILAENGVVAPLTNTSLTMQLDWMFTHFNGICRDNEDCFKKLKTALFMVGEIGGNDYNYALLQGKSFDQVRSLMPLVIQAIKDAVTKLNRKLVHISLGLVFMLCWPLFSSGYRGAIFAALTPGLNIIRMILVGSGIWKDDATVKSMSRYGDHREPLKGPLYYVSTITVACVLYWRTSPIAVASICNLCAGDGFADIVGRRFGGQKLPYNMNKSIAGSVAMATTGFFTSVGFMYYFSYLGYMEESMEIVLGFLVVSLASAVVESLPISTELDDNITVPLTSILVGSLVF